MRTAMLLLAAASIAAAAPRVDNVLIKMVPPGSTSLVGANMDAIRQTDLYRRMVAEQQLTDLDQFSKETGFDPRRDVSELLYVTTQAGSNALLARGTFHPAASSMRGAKIIRRGEYNIVSNAEGQSGFCILDSTLAAAGEVSAIEAALDEWKSGSHTGAQPLLARIAAMPASVPMWGVSTGFAGFIGEHMPRASNGIDFSKIFHGLQDTWFQADFTTGLRAVVHGTAATLQDAVNLRDAAKGLIGLGRLSVPENQPEMLKLWDGITVTQEGRSITINADIPENLLDKLPAMFNAPGRGRSRSSVK